MVVREDVVYKVRLDGIRFNNIPEEELYELYKDGRIGSRFMEIWIKHNFQGIEKVTKGNAPYDLLSTDYKKYDEKTLTKNGLSLTPSNQKGQGRKFDAEKFAQRNRELDYYVIVDIRNFPILKLTFVPTSSINTNIPKYSVNDAEIMFFRNKFLIDMISSSE